MMGRTREVSRLLAVAEDWEREIIKPTQRAPKGMWLVIKKTSSHSKVREDFKKKQDLSYLQKHRQGALHTPRQHCGPLLHPIVLISLLSYVPPPKKGGGGV